MGNTSNLSNPTPSYGDNFGTSVSISGDYAIVGTIFDDTGAGNSGSAYIYKEMAIRGIYKQLTNPT